MIELKPCPFCGKKWIELGKSKYGGWFARCEWCGAEVGHPDGEVEAAEVWNRRANHETD